ncbi:hypothetical protein [Streptosporangium amethystogenes]|uniref:hypothetical protein n=1 Tax=Streptosporangium amethystogenes TaxID=2002 RepID=UPI0004C9C4A1|nr:hypothetical protein [Streptosporangium amethystogenes]
MKNILMSSRMGFASVRRNTQLSYDSQVFLACGAAVPVLQDDPARFWVEANRRSASIAFAMTEAPAVPTFVGGSHAATTKHIGNGGLRGPQPWRHPPVII